jgi:hypothetical protein
MHHNQRKSKKAKLGKERSRRQETERPIFHFLFFISHFSLATPLSPEMTMKNDK